MKVWGKFLAGVFILAVGVWAGSSWAARPFATDDAGIVEQGKFEFEFGYDHCNQATGQNCLCCLGFKHGLTERMDIGLGIAHTFLPQQAEGLSPASLSLKYAVLKDLLAFSFAHELGGSAYVLNSVLTKKFGPVEIDINLGYGATGNSILPGSISYAIALIYGFEKFDIGCEFLGNKDGAQDWFLGLKWKILGGLTADIGYNGDFKGEKKKVTTGLHYEF